MRLVYLSSLNFFNGTWDTFHKTLVYIYNISLFIKDKLENGYWINISYVYEKHKEKKL